MIYIGVVAQNLMDFKLNFPAVIIGDMEFIYAESDLCFRGVNLNGVIITPKASKNPILIKRYKELFFYNSVR